MKSLNAYLTFNGNCREAMAFYQQCLGGELTLQTVGDSPMADKMPVKMKDCILHSELSSEAFMIMATDCVPENGLLKGNSVSLSISCTSEAEIRRLYEELAKNGSKAHELETTFWGALFGGLTDQYGHHWLLNFTGNPETDSR